MMGRMHVDLYDETGHALTRRAELLGEAPEALTRRAVWEWLARPQGPAEVPGLTPFESYRANWRV